MKLKTDRAALVRALAHAQSVVEKRQTIPILGNVMLTAQDKVVTLAATDMEIALAENIHAEVLQAGRCTAPATTLYEIARKLPEGAQIELTHPGGDALLALRSGRYSTSLQVLPPEDFPEMAAGALPREFALPAADLRGLIDRVRFAISNDDTRYYLCGLYLHPAVADDGTTPLLRAAATDGQRLARVEVPLPDGARPIDGHPLPAVIIPKKTVNEIRKLIDETTAPVRIALSSTRIQFRLETGVLLTSKLIDGTFPEYERVIPRGNDKVLMVEKKAFTAAVGRVSTIATDRSKPVKLSIAPGRMLISASSVEVGSASEELDGEAVVYNAAPLEIGFQARFLNDAADQIAGNLEFQLNDSQSPVVVQDEGDRSALYVLMPMRV